VISKEDGGRIGGFDLRRAKRAPGATNGHPVMGPSSVP